MEYSEDYISSAMLMGTVMDPSRFEILPDCPWIESLRRKTGQNDLFVYHHRKSKSFGLAQWTVKPKVFGQGVAVCVEICTFSAPPGHNPKDLPDMKWLLWRCQPGHVIHDEEQRKRMEAISERHRGLIERKNMMDEMERVLRKRGLDEAADKLSLEDVPDEGQDLDEMRELLNWAASGKIISTE